MEWRLIPESSNRGERTRCRVGEVQLGPVSPAGRMERPNRPLNGLHKADSETRTGVECKSSTTIIASEPWLRLP